MINLTKPSRFSKPWRFRLGNICSPGGRDCWLIQQQMDIRFKVSTGGQIGGVIGGVIGGAIDVLTERQKDVLVL